MRQRGAARSAVAAADGEMIAGSHAFGIAQELNLPVREVHTNGNEYVIVVRDDIPNARTPEAKLLALEDGVATIKGFRYDTEILEADYERAGVEIKPILFPNELNDIYREEEKRQAKEGVDAEKPVKTPEFSTIMMRVPTPLKARWTAMLESIDGPSLAAKLETVINNAKRGQLAQ